LIKQRFESEAEAIMSWENEQDRIVREGRVYSAPPEMVFAELKELRRRDRGEIYSSKTEAVETLLVERNDPLINLGLACYCTSREVFAALYKHSLEPARDMADDLYKRNLRMGCLSNQIIFHAHWRSDFPRDLVGEHEIFRIFSEADELELEAMVSNPTVSDKLLEEIFSMKGIMPQLSDDRWGAAVHYAARNERINTNKDTVHGPDMGHYDIHNAIYRFLEIAPVEPRWAWAVYNILDRVDPQQVYSPERIDHVLERWSGLKIGAEGNHTRLPMAQELRCYIAALYGRGFADGKSVYFGSPTAKDIALRCAYYARSDLTKKDMKAGYKRDKDVYLFAASFNSSVIRSRKLRQFFEEEQFGGSQLYLKHFAAVKKEYPYIGELSEGLKAEAGSDDPHSEKVAHDLANKVAERVVQQLLQAVGRLVIAASLTYLAFVTLKWLLMGAG